MGPLLPLHLLPPPRSPLVVVVTNNNNNKTEASNLLWWERCLVFHRCVEEPMKEAINRALSILRRRRLDFEFGRSHLELKKETQTMDDVISEEAKRNMKVGAVFYDFSFLFFSFLFFSFLFFSF